MDRTLTSCQLRDGSCNYGLTCELCQVESKTLTNLYSHMVSHIKTDLERAVRELMEGTRCKVCSQGFARASALVNHLGIKHGKVNDVLREKGYRVLPCVIATEGTKAAEVQANLLAIKKEKMEAVEEEEQETVEESAYFQ